MEDDYAKDELEKICEKAAAVYFKLLSHILPEELHETSKTMERSADQNSNQRPSQFEAAGLIFRIR
jgi:hypothetical protein